MGFEIIIKAYGEKIVYGTIFNYHQAIDTIKLLQQTGEYYGMKFVKVGKA